MKREATIITPKSFSIETFFNEIGDLQKDGVREFRIHKKPNEVYLRPRDNDGMYLLFSSHLSQDVALETYQENDDLDPRLMETLHAKHFYAVFANSIPLLRRVLTLMLDSVFRQCGEEAWVDDATGFIEPATLFLERAAAPDWQIRFAKHDHEG